MADFIVVDVVDGNSAEAAREAIGRLYAEIREEVWPIRSRFPPVPPATVGEYDPVIQNGTFYYWDPRPNVGGTKVAFGPPGDQDETDLMAFCLGKTVETTLGEVVLPSATEDLEVDGPWFTGQP